MNTGEKQLGDLDEPGLKEARPGVWHLRVFVGRRANGTPVQRRKTVDSGTGRIGAGIREARTELAKLRADVQEEGGTGRKMAPAGYTVTKLLDRYIAHCEEQGRSPTTLRGYRRIAATILVPRRGSMRVDDLDQDDLDDLYAELKAAGQKGNTIRHTHSLISSSLQFGLKKKLVRGRVNVATLASPPPVVNAEVIPPTPEQVRAMIARAETLDPAFATLVLVAALTGLRRGEVCGLRWSDIDGNTLTVAQSVYETHEGPLGVKAPKTRQKRRVGLDEVTLEALRRHRKAVDALADNLGLDVPEDAYVFSKSPQGSEPMRPGAVSERYSRLAKALGANSTRFHSLRHFHATRAIANGSDGVTVSKRLGHSDPSITFKIYAHAIEERDQELAAATGAELAPADAEDAA